MANERLTAAERTKQLTQAGYRIAKTKGIRKVTRAAIARATGVSDGLINRYFGSREGLRFAVMQYAADERDAKTLAEAAQTYELDGLTMTKALAADIKKLMH